MLGGYFNRGAVASWVITEENRWLASHTGDSRYLTANGWYTGGSRLGAYRQMLKSFHGFNTQVHYGATPEDVVAEIQRGRPVICGVMIKGGRLVSSGGVSHWVLATGWDGRVILNDPGTTSGRMIRYSLDDFDKSWKTQGRIYIPVFK